VDLLPLHRDLKRAMDIVTHEVFAGDGTVIDYQGDEQRGTHFVARLSAHELQQPGRVSSPNQSGSQQGEHAASMESFETLWRGEQARDLMTFVDAYAELRIRTPRHARAAREHHLHQPFAGSFGALGLAPHR